MHTYYLLHCDNADIDPLLIRHIDDIPSTIKIDWFQQDDFIVLSHLGNYRFIDKVSEYTKLLSSYNIQLMFVLDRLPSELSIDKLESTCYSFDSLTGETLWILCDEQGHLGSFVYNTLLSIPLPIYLMTKKIQIENLVNALREYAHAVSNDIRLLYPHYWDIDFITSSWALRDVGVYDYADSYGRGRESDFIKVFHPKIPLTIDILSKHVKIDVSDLTLPYRFSDTYTIDSDDLRPLRY